MPNISDLKLGKIIYQPTYKTKHFTTFDAKYRGKAVIVKRGDDHLGREARMIQAVHYKGIPKVIGYIQKSPRTHYLILQRLPGKGLGEYIKLTNSWQSERPSLKKSIEIMGGLADCFLAIYKAGYLYRDLNLDHVLVAKSKIGLVDHEWNVPVNKRGEAQVDSRAGTWETMAPEEFRKGNTINQASSVFTLGAVFMQLHTGSSPFWVNKDLIPNSRIRRRATQILQRQGLLFNTGNKKVSSFLQKALHPESKSRFQTIEAFQKALYNLL